MENLSHSRKPNRGSSHATLATKRTTSCNGAANLSSRTMYDDVFGGGPRFVTGGGGPTLSPRTEDYTEIFGGFHASRGASIPVLDLPSVSGSDEVMFDVRNPRFSYADVFGRFDNLDFPPSYEELMRQVNGGDDPDHDHDHDDYGDSSDEAWMQAETESLSEGSDHSGKYQHFSNGDYCEPIDTSMEFNMSYHKANVRSDRDVSNGITHVSQLHADPEYAYVIENPLQKMDKKDPPLDLTDDIDLEFTNGVVKKKHLRKTASHPSNRTIGEQTFTNDSTRRACRRTGSCSDEMFVTISNVNLRTVASDVPPPSRPPPFVNVENRDYQNGHHAASGGRMSDSSPPFFDVEIDASSAAAASAAAMKEAMDKAHAKLKSAKELLERKREGIKNSGKPGLKSDGKGKKERGDKTVEGSSYVTDERMQGMNVKEDSGMKTPVIDERQRAVKIQAADSLEGEKHFNAPERFVVEKLGKQYQSIQVFEETDGADEWQEAAQFFELVRTDHPKTVLELTNNEKVLLQGKKSHEQQHKAKMANFGASEQQLDSDKKIEAVREDHELEKVERDMKTAKESCERGEPVRISKPVKEARRHKGHEKKVKASQEVSEVEDDEQTPKAWKPVENGKKPTGADELAKREKQVNAQQKENKVEAGQAVEQRENGPQEKWTSRSVENPNRVDVFQKRKDDEKSWRETFEQEKNEINLQEVLEKVEKEKRLRDVLEQEEKGKRLKEAREREENARKYVLEQEEKERRLKEAREREENARRYALEQEEKERRLKEACEREENARRFALEQEEKEKRLKEAREREENTRRFALEQEEKEKRLKEAREREENARRYALEQEEKERRLKEAHEQEENARRYALEQEEKERRLKEAREREENARRFALEQEEKEKRLKEAREREENAKKEEARLLEESEKIWLMALEQLENEKRLKQSRLQEENEKIEKEALEKVVTESEEPENRIKETCEKETIGKGFIEACEKEGTKKRIRKKWKENVEKILEEAVEQKDYSIPETDVQDTEDDVKGVVDMFEETEEPLGVNYVYQHAERCEKDRQLKITKGTHQRGEGEDSVVSGAVNKLDYSKILQENQLVGNDQNVDVPKGSGESTLEENGKIKAESNDSERKSEAMEKGEIDAKFKKDDATHLCHQDGGVKKAGDAGIGIGQRNAERINSIPVIDSDNDNQGLKFAYECERARNIKKSQVPSHLEEDWDNFVSAQVAKESVETGRKEDTVRASVLEEKVSIQRTAQSTEMKDRKVNGILRPQEKEAERLKRERELEKEHLRRIEEEREREREREKDRMAIDKAALEAYERGYAEVRERAERAAVERATAEARQRAMSEARDRLEKVSAEAREKSSIETRLRAERAAVERATAEARERAVEKAMAERAAFEARERVERSMSDKFSTSRNVGMRTSSSASDLKDQHVQSSGSRYPYSSTNNGVEIESAQRCKARLERYRRTAERAAKALEEKNMRDLLAQREQAERNRLAESLGADVKRWSSGKEGNLRALLSTLQYILGPESGWQPVPLTEVITSAAVKKAYRKATLCVHPDKLQQRGASIQQKYICEKVFDLLKEAWNKFNSEER